MRDLRSNRKRIGPAGRKRTDFFHDFPKLRCFYPPGGAARGNARRMINQPLSGWFTGALIGPISCGSPLKRAPNDSSTTLFALQALCKGLYPSSHSKMYCFALGSSASWNLFLLLKCCLWTLKLGLFILPNRRQKTSPSQTGLGRAGPDTSARLLQPPVR